MADNNRVPQVGTHQKSAFLKMNENLFKKQKKELPSLAQADYFVVMVLDTRVLRKCQ